MNNILNIVCLCLTNSEGQIFLVQKGRNPFANTRGIPGGKLHYGESLLDGLRRESQEEISYTPHHPTYIGLFEFFDLGHIIVHAYHEQVKNTSLSFDLSDNEIVDGQRYDLATIDQQFIVFTPNHLQVITFLQQNIIS